MLMSFGWSRRQVGEKGEGSPEELVGSVNEWGCVRQTPARPVLLLTWRWGWGEDGYYRAIL